MRDGEAPLYFVGGRMVLGLPFNPILMFEMGLIYSTRRHVNIPPKFFASVGFVVYLTLIFPDESLFIDLYRNFPISSPSAMQ